MAVAGLHNVPLLESPILRESQSSSSSSRSRGHNRRISTRASSLLQMWRELEDECVVSRAQERSRSRSSNEAPDILSNCQENRISLENSSVSQNGSVINSGVHVEPLSEQDDHQSVSSEQSDLSEVERERVRKIFREWKSCGVTVQTPSAPHLNRNSRGQWLGETERERVRVVREWIQMTSQQREAFAANREEQVAEIDSQIERVRDGQIPARSEGRVGNSQRGIRKLCGRQALLDLLAKKEQERQEELHYLGEIRPVSNFAHRNRIQSLLRLRSFQNTRSNELRRTSSVAENELGLLRQRQTVSDLREGFLSRLDNNVHVQPNELSDNNADGFQEIQTHVNSAVEVLDVAQEPNEDDDDLDLDQLSREETVVQELVAQVEERLENEADNSTEETNAMDHFDASRENENLVEHSRSENGDFDDFDGETNVQLQNVEAPILEDLQEEFTEYEDREQENDEGELERRLLGVDSSNSALENNGDNGTPGDRVDSHYLSDDDDVYNNELRELTNRRRVSILLDSGFRENLDQLLQSYVERQTHAPDNWEVHETPAPLSVARAQAPDRDEESIQARPLPALSPRELARNLHYPNLSRHEIGQPPGTDWELVNDLRIDMAMLQQRLNNMQTILEACMDMQIELQRSVRQEVSSALNRSVNTSEFPNSTLPRDSFNWDCVRKGMCCICSDSNIDSLLYRCGHMCTCKACANVLVKGHGKCPMCQAPVVEVIRAYFIQE